MRDDDPSDLIHDLFAETVWEGHPLGRPVLGSRDTISTVARDQVHRFYRRLYNPSHFVIAAAGNLRHEELCSLAEGHMETGPRLATGQAPKVRTGGDVPPLNPATLVHHRPTEQAHISMGTSGYSRKDPRRFAFGVVNSALGGGMSSRLFQEIREKRGMAYSVYSYHTMFAETGLFAIYAGTTPSKAHEALRIIRSQLDDIAGGGLRDEELDRAKGHLKGSLVLSLEDTSGRMSRVGRSEISHGEILSVDEVLARTDAVTREDAEATAREVFSQPMALTVVGPFEAGAFDEFAPTGHSSSHAPGHEAEAAAYSGPDGSRSADWRA
jgi:predicted Zn-dependent peptidase